MKAEWRWLKVPRVESWPQRRTPKPSWISEPKASASAVAQSKPLPVSNICSLVLRMRRKRAVEIEAFGHRREDLAELLQALELDAGIAAPGLALGDLEAGPAAFEPVRLVGPVVLARLEFLFQHLAKIRDHLVGLAGLDDAFVDQALRNRSRPTVGCSWILRYMIGWVKAGSSPSL